MLKQLKLWILAAAAILLLEKTVMYFLINGKEQELAALETECSQIQLRRNAIAAQIGKQQHQLDNPQYQPGPLNGTGKPATQMEMSAFLKYTSRLVDNLGIKYISIQLNPGQTPSPQSKPGEQPNPARSYNVKVSSNYPQIVQLVDNIENQLNLDVGNIKVSSGKDDTGLHEASFDLALLKIAEENNLPAQIKSDEIPLPSQPVAKKDVGKDPFYQISGQVIKAAAGEEKPEELPQLHGIMEVMGKKAALLNHQIMHEGDIIKDYQLVRIDSNKVELKHYKHNYVINLRGLVSMVNAGSADTESRKGSL